MALATCPECQHPVSTGAEACPSCGLPFRPPPPPPSSGKTTYIVVAVVVAAVLALLAMVAVPVIGVVAAVAIPSFLVMQLRAKRSEAPTNLDAIRTAEKAYHAEWDEYLSVPACPASEPGREPVEFAGACTDEWNQLGWLPYTTVRCRYEVVAFNSGDWATSDFEATAECDIDGDGVYALYRASNSERSTMVTGNNVY
jgi:hypothetical protein